MLILGPGPHSEFQDNQPGLTKRLGEIFKILIVKVEIEMCSSE